MTFLGYGGEYNDPVNRLIIGQSQYQLHTVRYMAQTHQAIKQNFVTMHYSIGIIILTAQTAVKLLVVVFPQFYITPPHSPSLPREY